MMIKQVVFLQKRADMSMEEFIDYYENEHTRLAQRVGNMPSALRYVRRYVRPEKNAVTGEVHDCGFACIMEIWWDNREDFENSQRLVADPERLPLVVEDEKRLFATHSNPVCIVEEYDSPVGPEHVIYEWVPTVKSRHGGAE